ncbi:MAG: 50S ribosomal protein L4 [Nanoarchaeota archaeon]
MKAKILNLEGKEVKEIDLPKCFSEKIRSDIVQKYYEAEKKFSPFAPNLNAGKLNSASGRVRHIRHKWRTAYGHGMSRVPRKIMWRRGTQFYWIGATIASAVGGRRAHPPRVEHFEKQLKINKKEKKIAFLSAISSTAIPELVKKRYSSIDNIKIKLPIIIESNITTLKTKLFFNSLKNILDNLYSLAAKVKKKKAGGREKYKKSPGLLLIIGNEEKVKISGIDVRRVNEISIHDLYPLGRLTIYTEKAIHDLNKLSENKK